MKKTLNYIKFIIIISVVIIGTSNSRIFSFNANNNNLTKIVNLDTMSKKVYQFDYNRLYGAKDTLIGDLTGYVYNCPLCTGRLACMWKLDLSDGKTTYKDSVYGDVRIVASSTNLPCGTIIRFNSARIANEPIIAIVLDRGVNGNAIDLLSEDVQYAIALGRSTISYDILRFGWDNEG
ncbi:MAG: hypothetical protein GX951_02780 [Mollicutes bacterium]|nr:hypothetical protein [Mollicutes bacterium]